MTTWQPSEGLKRADAVVAEIEQAMEACGVVPPDGKPMRAVLGHRLTEIVAKAIDDARGAKDVPRHVTITSVDPKTPDGTVFSNGHVKNGAITITPTPGLPDGATVTIANGPHAGTHTFSTVSADTPVKRRGRPKGSKKKAKPAKGDKAPEAPPAAE